MSWFEATLRHLYQNRYDASGNRVSRLVYKSTWDNTTNTWGSAILQHAKHYTGLGSEIREKNSGSTVVMTLPQGLGRYTPGSNTSYEWYLKDHLGSTALVYRTGGSAGLGAQAAYDYQPYGKQISLMEPIDEVTERFTGKELDEEVGLNYFGARYYDADLGMWTTVDPMRQFASPYLYAANNPITHFDPDGKWDFQACGAYGIGGCISVTKYEDGTYRVIPSLGLGIGASASYSPLKSQVPAKERGDGAGMAFHAVVGVAEDGTGVGGEFREGFMFTGSNDDLSGHVFANLQGSVSLLVLEGSLQSNVQITSTSSSTEIQADLSPKVGASEGNGGLMAFMGFSGIFQFDGAEDK